MALQPSVVMQMKAFESVAYAIKMRAAPVIGVALWRANEGRHCKGAPPGHKASGVAGDFLAQCAVVAHVAGLVRCAARARGQKGAAGVTPSAHARQGARPQVHSKQGKRKTLTKYEQCNAQEARHGAQNGVENNGHAIEVRKVEEKPQRGEAQDEIKAHGRVGKV